MKKEHPKVINQWLIYEADNTLDEVCALLVLLRENLDAKPTHSPYHTTRAINGILSVLTQASQHINDWYECEPTKAKP
jgi:hypothetical protein